MITILDTKVFVYQVTDEGDKLIKVCSNHSEATRLINDLDKKYGKTTKFETTRN